jgi:hypothetical protein
VCYQYQYQYQYMRTLPVHAYILHSYRTQNSYMFIFNISNLFLGPKFCFISMQYAGIWLKFMGCGPYLLSVTFTISMQYFGSAINLSNHHVVRTWLCQRCFVYADSATLWNWLKGQPAWNYHINIYKLSYNLNQMIPILKICKTVHFSFIVLFYPSFELSNHQSIYFAKN